MRIGFIGLGKMGSRMVERLLEKKHRVVLYARKQASMRALAKKGAIAAKTYEEFAEALGKNKIVFLMVTHGKAVDDVIKSLAPFLHRGDIVIDGGNSFWKDSAKRARALAKKGIKFLDAGVSGGLEGARNGASVMVGGDKSAFRKCAPLFRDLSVKDGYAYMGKSGSGHFVKMVHNGIEYSLLQSYAEGYMLLKNGPFRLDLNEVTKVYKNGSVIRGWLVDLLARALKKDKNLAKQGGAIGGGSTGTWALKSAKEARVKMPALEEAMKTRKRSAKKRDFSTKVVAALRKEFGGHIPPKGK